MQILTQSICFFRDTIKNTDRFSFNKCKTTFYFYFPFISVEPRVYTNNCIMDALFIIASRTSFSEHRHLSMVTRLTAWKRLASNGLANGNGLNQVVSKGILGNKVG